MERRGPALLLVLLVLASLGGCSRGASPATSQGTGGTMATGGTTAAGGTTPTGGTTAAGGTTGNAGSSASAGAAGTTNDAGAAGSANDAAGAEASGATDARTDGAASPDVAARPIVKVMTFNIRYGTAPDGDDAWAIRKPLAFDVFMRQKADLVGVQEALDAQLVDIDGAVAGYLRIGVGRNDGAKKGEYSAIYYRSERFAVDSSGTFWFSDTPEVPGSVSWGNTIPRICTWGHFTDRVTGHGVYHFNVHLDHLSQPSREKSVAFLMKRAAERPIATDPVIVTGDFNAGEENLAIRFMQGDVMLEGASNPLPLVDTFRALYPNETQVLTGHGFNGGTQGAKIDYVFFHRGQGQMALAAEIDRTNVAGRYPSDHYPVTGTLRLP